MLSSAVSFLFVLALAGPSLVDLEDVGLYIRFSLSPYLCSLINLKFLGNDFGIEAWPEERNGF